MSATKKIITVGYELPGKSDSLVDFNAKNSLMDSDIVIFSPETPSGYDDSYQGKQSYSDTGSFQYKDATQHWKNELTSFLNSGCTVFLFLSEKESFFLKTGTKEYKPKVTINHVDQHHNYEFLPIGIWPVPHILDTEPQERHDPHIWENTLILPQSTRPLWTLKTA